MEQTLLAGAMFLATFLSPQTPSIQSAEMPQIEQVATYRVEKGDTILSIAKSHYGDEGYWTTIWNDNEDILDPNLIEVDTLIKLREDEQEEPEELKKELSEKYNKLKTQPNKPEVSKKVEEKASSTSFEKAEPTQTPTPAAVGGGYSGGPLNEAQINFLGSCESGMRPNTNTGNGFYGAFQFTVGTWNSMGTGYERADLAPLEVQVDAVQRLLSRSSIYTQFPGCAAKMRSMGLI